MEKLIFVCDNCGKDTKDYTVEMGWIHIDDNGFFIYNKKL